MEKIILIHSPSSKIKIFEDILQYCTGHLNNGKHARKKCIKIGKKYINVLFGVVITVYNVKL